VNETSPVAKVRESLAVLTRRLGPLGPTLARLTVGLVFMFSGWGKLHALPDTVERFAEWGIPMPAFNARLASFTELFGGILVLIGLGTRIAVLPMAFTMVIALITAKRSEIEGFVDLVGQLEWSYIVIFLWLAVAGAGPLSLDGLIAPRLARWFGKKSGPPETAPA
jgi:putative oxidoreductase